MYALLTFLLGVVSLVAAVLTPLRMPGTWIILLAAFIHGWWTDWHAITLNVMLILFGLAVIGEVIEFAASAVTARRAGASRRAAWGGIIGGILGALLLAIPIPLLGAVIGAVLGCFAGAALAELSARPDLYRGAEVGVASAIGYVIGAVSKLAIALVMAVLAMSLTVRGCIRYEPPPPALEPAPTSPTVVPAVGG